ncbi:MAG: PTS N-acetylgalactosamine transporter subunit IIB [Peptostreptococcus sp.]|uniref:PTS N-acetylgalactosamine transporter subunit IIB n=1 Tax=Peptostreptococcus sp. TaxID=1262 RepID=UPI002FC926D2
MNTPNILATRIDNRLVHGQVGMTWSNSIGANLVVVANDAVSKDNVQQSLMEMVLPDTIGIRFFSIEKTIKVIHKASPKQHIFLVVKTPQDALKLVEGGVPIKSINIGNLHFGDGKKQLTSVISVNDDDVATFNKLHDLGVELEVRGIPTDKSTDLMKILKEY